MRLNHEEHERRWGRKQKQYEFEINQLKERAGFESTEMEKLRKENERLKKTQEVEQHNKVGRVMAPQGGPLVVRDLIDITRRMKEQLGQTLKMETVEIITGAGETETCKTRHEVMTAEIIAETREIEGELDGVRETKNEHTHGGSGGQWGRAGRTCWDPVQAAG